MTKDFICDKIIKSLKDSEKYGEVSEWFKELVLKTSDTATYRGFESHPLRQIIFAELFRYFYINVQKYPSGEGAPLLRE